MKHDYQPRSKAIAANRRRRPQAALTLFAVLIAASSTALAYTIEWDSAAPVIESRLDTERNDATGSSENTQPSSFIFDNFMRLAGGSTTVTVSGGPVDSLRQAVYRDSIRRDFTIRKTNDSESPVVEAAVDVFALFELNAFPEMRAEVTDWANFQVIAQVQGTGLTINKFWSLDGYLDDGLKMTRSVLLRDTELLAVDTSYQLELYVWTNVVRAWDGQSAKTGTSRYTTVSAMLTVPEPRTDSLFVTGALLVMLATRAFSGGRGGAPLVR